MDILSRWLILMNQKYSALKSVWILSAFLCFGLQDSAAQVFPVRADIHMRAPYSLYLGDYTIPGTDRMKISLRLLQTNRPLYSVGLRVTIEGAGITITSSPNGVYEEIVLQGGALLEISGSDLHTWLNPSNLIFTGYSKEDYLRTKKLPEGIYQISVEAVDFRNYTAGLVVSNKATATAWFMLNEPPRFNQPLAGNVVRTTFPQNVYFEWLPGHLNSPNAAFQTDYEFQLFEINPAEIEEQRTSIDAQVANQAVQTSQIFYETVISTPVFVYDNQHPALIPGKYYAARVRAVERNNLDIFKNNGYSEVIWFRFGETCSPASNLRSVVPDFRRAELEWEGKQNHSRFVVSYRPEGGSHWYEQESLIANTKLTDLQPDAAYEYQVRAYCGQLPAAVSDIHTFQTPPNEHEAEVRCGESVTPHIVDTGALLASASPGTTFKVGAFEMRVTEVSGSDGTFNGKGEIFVPFIATSVKTEFSSIRVNSKGEVFEGLVKAQSSGLSLMDQELLRKLTEEEQNEVTKNSRLCIEDALAETEAEVVPGTPVVVIGDFVVAKGDTLIVNGNIVIADETTTLQPDDVITIPRQKDKGQNIVINKPEGEKEGKKHYSVKGSSTAGTGNLGALEKELDDLVKKALNDLRESTRDSAKSLGKRVEDLSKQILGVLKENDLPKELVGGTDETFLWEGMSKHKEIPHTSDIPDSPIGLIYLRHRDLFEADSTLQFFHAKTTMIKSYLQKEKLQQLRNTIRNHLTRLDQSELDQYQP
ncbi:MAG: fibronectin type III domain-containing protein, partial [Chryseosolibacter sp.]